MIKETVAQYASPEELRRIGAAFAIFLAMLLLILCVWFIIFPGMRSGSLPGEFSPVAVVHETTTGWLDPLEYPATKAQVLPPVNPKTLLQASPALVARGKELYEANCVPCHGSTGQGNGPAAIGYQPPPRDFTQPRGWLNGFGLAGIYRTLTEGIPDTMMPTFGYLPARDRMALAHYIQAFARFKRPPEDPEPLKALESVLRTERQVIPARIPVSMAMRKLEEEARPAPPLRLSTDLLRRVVRDPARAARFLSGLRGWRTDVRRLADAVTAGAPADGFSPDAAELDGRQWRELQRDLDAALRPGSEDR